MRAGVCRDCIAVFGSPVPSRCPACGSPRIAAHAEFAALAIAHVDCDAFYAAVEKRDDPSLRDKAVIIGGSRRGVVLTACYNARIAGVRSAMPMFKALQLCPGATVVRPDMAKYAAVGRALRVMMGELTPRVQPVSIDEAFLDLDGTQTLHGACPAVTLARFARRVERDLGITVSFGLSDCKFLAKLASDIDKPRGFTVIGRAEAAAVLAPRPVGAISGIGATTQARLARIGFVTIGDIQACPEAEFSRRTGRDSSGLWRLAHGLDARPVQSRGASKSVSAETTFTADLAAADDLHPILFRLCEKVAARLTADGYAAGGVVLKLKGRDFRLKTRSQTPVAATQLATRLFAVARALLAPELDGTRYRLIGVAACGLRPALEADGGDLLDTTVDRRKTTAAAIDAVRARFGTDAIVHAITLPRPARRP